jgi:serine/threonine protein kinase
MTDREMKVGRASRSPQKQVAAFYQDQFFGFEVKLVLEYCSFGNLRQALDKGAFMATLGRPDYPAVIEVAADIARGMLHLHSLNIIHSDLKVSKRPVQKILYCKGDALWLIRFASTDFFVLLHPAHN